MHAVPFRAMAIWCGCMAMQARWPCRAMQAVRGPAQAVAQDAPPRILPPMCSLHRDGFPRRPWLRWVALFCRGWDRNCYSHKQPICIPPPFALDSPVNWPNLVGLDHRRRWAAKLDTLLEGSAEKRDERREMRDEPQPCAFKLQAGLVTAWLGLLLAGAAPIRGDQGHLVGIG